MLTKVRLRLRVLFPSNVSGTEHCVPQNIHVAEKWNPAGFARDFVPNENTWRFMESLAQADSVDLSGITEKEKAYLNALLKASIARQLWRNEGYYEVMNRDDKAVLKALEVLGK